MAQPRVTELLNAGYGAAPAAAGWVPSAAMRRHPPRDDSEQEVGALIEAEHVGVFRFILGLVADEALAEDLAQDTFVAAYQRARQLRQPESGRSWLYSIARNVVRQHWRHQHVIRWVRWEEADAGHGQHDGEWPELLAVLRSLAREEREVILLKALLGFTAREIGDILGIQEEAARQRWRRARDKARSALAPAKRVGPPTEESGATTLAPRRGRDDDAL